MCVIELNPFGPQNGALLFAWQRDALILAGWWPRPVFRWDMAGLSVIFRSESNCSQVCHHRYWRTWAAAEADLRKIGCPGAIGRARLFGGCPVAHALV